MLHTLSCLKKLAFLHWKLTKQGLLTGTMSSFFESLKAGEEQGASDDDEWQCNEGIDDENEDMGPAEDSSSGSLSDIKLALKCGKHPQLSYFLHV